MTQQLRPHTAITGNPVLGDCVGQSIQLPSNSSCDSSYPDPAMVLNLPTRF